mmetsp:Transcript_22679/g.53672  ORF Transcript_22679/g.53672 Transcript_22679/m.53672 type:complete len:140 (+) Transcript_22679:109-528(+)
MLLSLNIIYLITDYLFYSHFYVFCLLLSPLSESPVNGAAAAAAADHNCQDMKMKRKLNVIHKPKSGVCVCVHKLKQNRNDHYGRSRCPDVAIDLFTIEQAIDRVKKTKYFRFDLTTQVQLLRQRGICDSDNNKTSRRRN